MDSSSSDSERANIRDSSLVVENTTKVKKLKSKGKAKAKVDCSSSIKKRSIEAKKMTDKVEHLLKRLFHAYSLSSSSGSDINSATMDRVKKMESMDVDVDDKYGFARSFESVKTTDFDRESEIDVYLIETLVKVKDESTFDILAWWKQNGHRFEILSAISIDILAIPVSTVASESTFSIGGRIIDSSRSSLAPKTVEALICTQNWLISKPIDLEFCKELEEDAAIEEGFRAIMDEEKDIEDFSSLTSTSIN